LVLLLMTACAHAAVAQEPTVPYDSSALIGIDALQSDFRAFRQSLESAHGGLYRYTSKAFMDSVFDRAYRSIGKPMPESGLFALVTAVISTIKDGHTSAVSSRARVNMLKVASVLPLRIHYAGTMPYVVGTLDTDIPLGCELLAIDRRGIRSIQDSIFSHLSADGEIVTGKYWKLNEDFPYLYYLYVSRKPTASVECRQAGRTKRSWTVRSVPRSVLRAHLDSVAPDRAERLRPPLRLESLPVPRAMRLVLGSFAGDQDFAHFADSAFRTIRAGHVADLVIDLRGNDGGETAGRTLFSYLAIGPFRFVDRIETRTNSLTSIGQFTHLDSTFVDSFARQLVTMEPGRYRVRDDADSLLATTRPSPDRFDGRVWVITDGETFSNGAAAAIPIRSTRRGLFIGEETGGAYHGYTAGNLVVITLPASGIRVIVPLQAYFMAMGDSTGLRRGIKPDYQADATVADLLAGRDDQLAKTLELIRDARRRSSERAKQRRESAGRW
jgi:hypothetical protein